jgi:hypothetical protein
MAMKQMYKVHYIIIILVSFTLVLNASCSKENFKSLSDLSALRNELIKEYKENDINVTVQNSSVLGISFINSSFNNLGEQEREKKAREIALFAKNHYPSIDSIDKIWVSFVASKNYIIIQYSNGLGTYVFDKRSLTNTLSGTSDSQGIVATSYDPGTNRTQIYLSNNLQVYSDSQGGIMLSPQFIILGNNVAAPRVTIPQSVTLNFSTNSRKRMFPDNPPLIIYMDGHKTFSSNARTTNVLGGDAEKSVNEFLSQEISYAQFVQLTKAGEVKFNLGAKEFKLTKSHIYALLAMRKCVEELRCE